LRGARRRTYADSRIKNLLITLLHFAVVTAKLCGPGGVRAGSPNARVIMLNEKRWRRK
jgi:hypothetical protein